MGLNPSEDQFWLILETEHGKFDLRMTPWNNAMSSMKVAQAEYGWHGYGISRLHGALCSGTIDGSEVNGSAYFQKVCVQAPSPPWFWGMLHLDDGSYIDWFVPHVSPTLTAKDSDIGKEGTLHTILFPWVACFMMCRGREVKNSVK